MAKKVKHDIERDEKKTNAVLGMVLSLVAAVVFFIGFVVIAITALSAVESGRYAGLLGLFANYEGAIFIGFYILDGCFFLWNLIKLITTWRKQ